MQCMLANLHAMVFDDIPKTLGFNSPSLFRICKILGIGQPSRLPVAEFSHTKSRVNRQEPSGFGTRWTWLHSVACDSLITPSFFKASICFRISRCFSSEWRRGGALLHGSLRLDSSTLISWMEPSPSCTKTRRFLAIHSRFREIEFCNGGEKVRLSPILSRI